MVTFARRALAVLALVVLCGAVSLTVHGDEQTVQARANGWKLVFADTFNQPLDLERWGRYEGQPGGNPGGWWEPSHVVVRDGKLRLETYRDPRYGNRWVSGGLSNSFALKQTYGRYDVRVRMDGGHGIQGVLLLWPVRDVWPPEIDFFETGGANPRRDSMSATLHYGRENHIIQRSLRRDFRRWHTIGVRWTPGQVVYTINGRAWATVRSRHVPSEQMELALQTHAGDCGDEYAPCPNASTPRHVAMEVDWVRAYSWVRP
jgi:beta-glucanase (GH16 family)